MNRTDRPVLERSKPKVCVADLGRDEIVARLRRALRGRGVEAAYVFGSVAEGSPHAWSDVDLILVCRTDEPFVDRPRRFRDLWDQTGLPLDLLVYTPAEFERLRREPVGFWKSFREHHVRIL